MSTSEVLLINPRRRRKARRKNPSAAQRRARAAFAAASRARSRSANPSRRRRAANPRRRRRNPGVAVSAVPYAANPRRRRRHARRRSNPISLYRRARRRSNPISMSGIMGPIKEAAIQGAGAIAFDLGYGYVNKYLPQQLRIVPGAPGLGDAVRAIITVIAGNQLSRFTKGLSKKAAVGALTIQARDLIAGMLPANFAMHGRLGYASPAAVIGMNARIAPNRTVNTGAYSQPGATALLNAYSPPGVTALLNGNARAREGYAR